MKVFTTAALLAGTTLLTACGGGATAPDGAITLTEINTFGEELFTTLNALEADEFVALDEDALVAKGSATYDGYMIGAITGSDDGLIGRTSLDATFTDGGSLSGDVTDIAYVFGVNTEETVEDPEEELTFEPLPDSTEIRALDGALALSGGALSSSPLDDFSRINITVTGNVIIPADISETTNEENYNITGTVEGVVSETDTFLGFGELMAESSDAGFDVEVVVVAD